MTLPDSLADRTPFPPTSLAVVLGVTALLVWRLLAVAGVGAPALVGVGAGILVALSLWLVGWDRWGAVGTFLASLLVAPVALGVVAAAGGSAVVAVTRSSAGGIGAVLPAVAATLLLVFGCVTGVFGAVASTRGVVDRTRAGTYTNVASRTVAVPVFAAVALLASDLADGTEGGLFGVQQLGGALLGALFDPTPGRPHLTVFCLLAGATVVGVWRLLTLLPLTELAPADERGIPEAIAGAQSRLLWAGLLILLLSPPFALVELLPSGQALLADLLPPAAYEVLVGLTGAPWLRRLLWRFLVGSLAVAGAVWLLRRTVRSSADRVGSVVAPYAGGAVLTVVVVAVAETVLAMVTARVAGTPAGPLVDELVGQFLAFSSAGVLLLWLAVAVSAVTGVLAGTLWLLLRVGYVPERTAGVAVAAAGLFVASAVGVVVGASAALVLAGLVGAVVVWDAGAFGTRLRREVGSVPDGRRAELVHTGGTLAVGCLGAVSTVALTRAVVGSIPVVPDVATLASVVCLVALAALVTALR